MPYNVTLIPGDGVGPELTEATLKVLEATGITFNWDIQEVGEAAYKKTGSPLPEKVLASIRKNKVGLKGPVTTPVGTGFRSVNVALRQAFDLYACYRPCKSQPGIRTRFDGVDIMAVRENSEDLYAGIEFERGSPEALKLIDFISAAGQKKIGADSGISIKPISERGTRRIAAFAFDYARANGRKKVSCIHKANIMKFTDGLFLATANEMAKSYPDIQYEDVIVDNLCMQLVRNPERYDVLLMPNLYGDIVSELCAGLVGGVGVVPSANVGKDIAIFEPAHGSAPKYAGLNKVNPMAMMLAASMMLTYLGENEASDHLNRALADVVAEGKTVTYDLKPSPDDPTAATTMQVAEAVSKRMKERIHA